MSLQVVFVSVECDLNFCRFDKKFHCKPQCLFESILNWHTMIDNNHVPFPLANTCIGTSVVQGLPENPQVIYETFCRRKTIYFVKGDACDTFWFS